MRGVHEGAGRTDAEQGAVAARRLMQYNDKYSSCCKMSRLRNTPHGNNALRIRRSIHGAAKEGPPTVHVTCLTYLHISKGL